jgi:hypothetical protein
VCSRLFITLNSNEFTRNSKSLDSCTKQSFIGERHNLKMATLLVVKRFSSLAILLIVASSVLLFCDASVFRIGGVFRKTTNAGIIDPSGSERLSAFVMAINDFNTKYGAPNNVTIQYAIRDAKGSYMTTAAAAISMATTAFPKFGGVRAIVGGGSDFGAMAVSSIINELSIPQVVYGAPTSQLSHGSLYPFVSRVYPSDAFEARGLASVINAMGWKRIFVVYSQDTYGSDALVEFHDAATKLGLNVVYEFGVQLTHLTLGSNTAQDDAIAALKQYDARIIVLLVSDIQSATEFLVAADSAGSITSNTVLLGPSHITTNAIFSGVTTGSAKAAFIQKALQGYLGIQFADRDWMVTTTGKSFITKYRAQQRTDVVPGTGLCSTLTDNDGNLLYEVNATGRAVCTGLNYGAFAADGSDIEPLIAYAYDATKFMLKSIFLQDDGSIKAPAASTTGAQLMNKIVTYRGTNGMTGYLNMSLGLAGASDYQRGDRISGIRYQVVNFVAPNASVQSWGFRRVGTWASEGGYVPCATDPTMQTALTGGCQEEINWGTEGNRRPNDRADPIVAAMPASVAYLLLALAVILLVLDIFLTVLFVVYRRSKILKASQLPLLWIVLVSLILGSWRVLSSMAGLLVNIGGCYAQYWLGHLTFVGLIALMFMNARVYIIVSAGLRKVKVSARHVLLATLGCTSAMIVYMILSNILSPITVKEVSTVAITGQYTKHYYCESHSVAADAVLYAFEGAVLVVNLTLCWKTRMVPGIINKSKEIARIVSVVTFVAVIVLILEYAISFDPWVDELITGLAFFVCCLTLFWRYFSPTAYFLLNGYDLDRNLNVVKRAELDAKVAVTDGTADCSGAPMKKQKADAIVVKFATEDQRKVVTKFMPSMAPKTIGECNELVSFLQAHIAELAVQAIRFSSANRGGDSSGNSGQSDSHHSSSSSSSVCDDLVPEADQLIQLTREQRPDLACPTEPK